MRIRSFTTMTLLVVLASVGTSAAAAGQTNLSVRTPSDTVREFYRALRERRFRDAFALSIYRPAIDNLSTEEFDDLRPEFERIATAVPESVTIGGEAISVDTATVFVRIGPGDTTPPETVTLVRGPGNSWIVGDHANQEVVKTSGKDFFFRARIDTHHAEVQSALLRIANAQALHSSLNGGAFADLPTLIRTVPALRDVATPESTGYRFHITLGKGNRSYKAGAEPVRYNRSGRLSFFMDQAGMKSKDTGGKPYNP